MPIFTYSVLCATTDGFYIHSCGAVIAENKNEAIGLAYGEIKKNKPNELIAEIITFEITAATIEAAGYEPPHEQARIRSGES